MSVPFKQFDLGSVIQTAEAIKGMRRQENTDKLRDQYLGEQIQSTQQNRQIAGDENTRNQQKFQQDNDNLNARHNFLVAQTVEAMPDPHAGIRQYAPEMIQEIDAHYGPGSFEKMTAEQLKASLGQAKQFYGAKAGFSQAGTPEQQIAGQQRENAAKIDYERDQEAAKTQHGYRLEEINAQGKVTAARNSFRPMSPDEVQAAGLPSGTSAQVNESTGQISVLSKRDATANLSQKDATTARMKLNTVALARKQLNDIRDAFEGSKGADGNRVGGIKDTGSAGPSWTGQGVIPTEGGAKFDKSVDMMRSTLTALTRVPGVGAMSDYETKLDQSKFPSRKEYESVTQQNIDALDDMLTLIERGYTDLLGGNAQGQQQGQQQAPQQQPQPQQQRAPVQVGSDEQYNALPPGTQYTAPDGSTRTKR